MLSVMAGAMLYIRLAPVDVARWHLAPAAGSPTVGVQTGPQGARLVVEFEAATAAEVLARLDSFAMITPRTRRIAGSAESGLITWESRSAFWGFPDYTTAAATDGAGGATLRILARQRFGSQDFGVNAARLTAWLHLLRGDSAPVDSLSQ